ncbi:MAG: FHA domain-containing protein [Verrucomicrobiales bacterium]|nr:FHA domain-containing protein [Verrucomicrobiales bacterium]
MPKLVCLTAGFTDRVFEVPSEKASIGRLDDNRFPIAEPSVSSHHCEVWTKGDDIVVKDLNSTNGTFINEAQIAPEKETPLRPGQTLRLGQVEFRYETGKRQTEQPRPTVKIGEAAGSPTTVIAKKNSAFTKKTNNTNKIFLAVGVVLGIIIIALLVIAFSGLGQSTP